MSMWLGSWGYLDTAIRALITNPGFTDGTVTDMVALEGTIDESSLEFCGLEYG